MKSREEITKEITTKRVQAGSPSKPVSKAEVAAERARQLAKIKDHVEYKRLGLYLAEAMGFRVDEIAPLVVGAAKLVGGAIAGEVATSAAKKVLKKKKGSAALQAGPEGVAVGNDKAKKKGELRAQAASDDDLEEGKGALLKGGLKRAGRGLKKAAKDPRVQAAALEAGAALATNAAAKKRGGAGEVQEGKIMNSYVKKLMEADESEGEAARKKAKAVANSAKAKKKRKVKPLEIIPYAEEKKRRKAAFQNAPGDK